MNGIKKHMDRISIAIIVVTMIICLIPIPVSADWSEGFSNDNLDDWYIWADEWSSDSIATIDDSWEIEDNSLISAGIPNFKQFNHACRVINAINGSWSINHYWPELGKSGTGYTIITQLTLGIRWDYRNTDTNLHGIEFNINRGGLYFEDYFAFASWNYGSTPLSTNTSYLDETKSRDWQNFRIERFEKIVVYLDNVEIFSLPAHYDEIPVFDELCLFAMVGSGIKFDDIDATANTSDDDNDFPMQLLISGLVLATALVTGGLIYQNYKKKRSLRISSRNSRFFSSLDNKEHKLHKFLISLTQKDAHNYESTSKFPSELLYYKHLLHPTRLTILKVLFDEFQVTSVELKNTLRISWGDYTNHVKSLEEKGLVEVRDEFNNQGRQQVIYLTQYGKNTFQIVKELLIELLENPTIDTYGQEDSPLYPKN